MARKKKYVLTDDHRLQLKPWADRWIANALNCEPMTGKDREAMRVAIRGLYESANLIPPPPERIVFVPSPLVAALAGGFAAAIWYLRKNPATEDATRAATEDATEDATRAATLAATWDATWDATEDATAAATRDATRAATEDATWDATRAATEDATEDATRAATLAATWDATEDATRAATLAATWAAAWAAAWAANHRPMVKFFLMCAQNFWRMRDGGNQWSGYVSFLSFFRHVAKLDLPIYEKFQHYEAAAINGGPRIMHEKFCIVSDRPEFIHRDAQNRPHCETGPFCRWRDGWSLYYWHGVRVPRQIIEEPETLTAEQIEAEKNAEVRRVMIERFGAGRWLKTGGAKLLGEDEFGKLWEKPRGEDTPIRMVEVLNSTPEPDGTRNTYFLRVPPAVKTAYEGVAWTFGKTIKEYRPAVET